MKIYFCDICNESIPLSDIKVGRSTTIKGKIFCGQCNPLNEVPSRKELRLGFLVPLVLFLAAAGMAGFALYHSWRVGRRVDPRTVDLEASLGRIEQQVSGAQEALDDLQDEQRAVAALVASLEESQSPLRNGLDAAVGRLDRTERSVQELRGLLDVLRSDRETLERLGVQQDRLELSLDELRQQITGLEGRLEGVAVGGGPDEAVGAIVPPVDSPEETAFDEETQDLLRQLESEDASVRWTAVDELARKRDPALIPFLLPLLEDPDAFVQFRVISTAREFNTREAVPRLIALLRDGDAIVREEALEALVVLTGRPARFDTSAAPEDRESAIVEWEDWYRRNRERFEGSP